MAELIFPALTAYMVWGPNGGTVTGACTCYKIVS